MSCAMNVAVHPIGTVKSVFHFKNGTPRQSSLCDSARGVITIEKSTFNNPEHSLMGLEEFSHAWIIFVFHKSNMHTKAKVKPPRLNGQKVGVFASRSPYRPNNIGLSLVKIDKIEGASVHISGIDILDGTPVLDIKPYIPEYDKPKGELTQTQCETPSLDSCATTDIIQDSLGGYNSNDLSSSKTGQNQETVNKSSVDHRHKQTGTHFVNTQGVLTTDSIEDNTTITTEGHNFARECDHRTNPQESINNLINDPGSSSNDEDMKKDMNPISEGFYAISSALERAGESLGRVEAGKKSPMEQLMERQHLSIPPDDNLFSDLIHIEYINISNDNLTSKTDVEQQVCINSEQSSHHNFHFPEELATDEVNIMDIVNTTVSNIDVENRKTKCLEALPSSSESSCKDFKMSTFVAPWLLNPPVPKLNVTFTSQALKQLHHFSKQADDSRYMLQMFSSPEEVQKSISDILREDPRSVYRRQHFRDNLYFFAVDVLHVTCWFDEDTAQVVRIKPIAFAPKLQQL